MLWMHVPAHVRSAATTKVSEKMLQGRWLERRTGSPSYHAYLAHGSLRIGSGNRGGQHGLHYQYHGQPGCGDGTVDVVITKYTLPVHIGGEGQRRT